MCITCPVDELHPHPSYDRHNLSVPAFKLSTLADLGDFAFQFPLIVTREHVIVDGYGRWELAKRKGRSTLECIEYDLTHEEALQWLLRTHGPAEGLNDFTRIELALDLEPYFREKARLHQQEGGRGKGLSKLTIADRANSRSEIARVADVSVGNVTKVKHILAHACLSVLEAVRAREVSINIADKWSYEPKATQQENLRLLRIEQGIRMKARQLVGAHLAKGSQSIAREGAYTVADVFSLVQQLGNMSPEELIRLGPVAVNAVRVPGKAIFVTEELTQIFRPRQEVLIE